MMRNLLAMAVLATMLSATVGYGAEGEYVARCHNGCFVGAKEAETGVISFKGIPYAQQPVGALRWKAPLPLKKSKAVYDAKEFGSAPLQNIDKGDPDLIGTANGEDCLNVNVWTADMTTKKKPVMFYIHGGSYGWEAARMPFYDMQYMVKDNPDVVLVTFDYRVNSMGFFDLSKVPDGKVYKSSDFKDSGYLGVLDTIAALKWTKKNIKAFGGDPDNITVFGESAGGGMTSILLVTKQAKGLFKRAIAQSGALNLTMNKETIERLGQTESLMKATGAKNMDDLMALTKEEILKGWLAESGKMGPEGGTTVQSLNSHPRRGGGSIITEDPLEVLRQGASKDVDVMIGTTADEWNYWIPLMPGNMQERMAYINNLNFVSMESYRKKIAVEKQGFIDEYLKIARDRGGKWDKRHPGFWRRMEMMTDRAFRFPAIKMAEAHSSAGGKGKTYMYYFAKESDLADWAGAPHSIELPYVFNNPKAGGTEIYGNVDPVLARKMCRAWTNFARTGNPSLDDFVWEQYDVNWRKTMMVGNDNSIRMVEKPLDEQRRLMEMTGIYYTV